MADDFLRMLTQVAIAILTVFTVYLASKEGWRSKAKAKRRTSTFIFASAIFLGFGSCGLSYLDYKKELADADASHLAEVQRSKEYAKVVSNQRRTLDTANTIIELQRRLNEKSDLLNKLQRATLGNITGGNQAPILKVFISKAQYGGSPKIKYYIINFDLITDGEFPLHNVNGSITDFYIPTTLAFGIRHDRNKHSATKEGFDEAKHKLTDYHSLHERTIGSMTKENSYVFHTSTLSPSQVSYKIYTYVVKIHWEQGEITWYLNLEEKVDSLIIKDAELVINGKKQKNYSNFIQYTYQR